MLRASGASAAPCEAQGAEICTGPGAFWRISLAVIILNFCFQSRPKHVLDVVVGLCLCFSGGGGKMEKKMETAIVYSGYIGVMEKKMETTILNPRP